MKKIINNNLYDTDTAREMGCWSNMADIRNFHWFHETLYRKRTGEFFLHGEGGPASKYAVSAGQNCWSGGEKIIPLSAASAREWAEEHLDADEYEEIFGLPDEDTEPAALNVMLDGALMARLRARAAEEGASLTATVEKLLRAGLDS